MSQDITLDDLAVMINNMDQRIDKRLDGIDNRLNSHDSKFIDITERLDRIEDRLSNVAYKFEVKELEKRVEALEK